LTSTCAGRRRASAPMSSWPGRSRPCTRSRRAAMVLRGCMRSCAARDPGPEVIFHSDRGCQQYTSAEFVSLAGESQARPADLAQPGRCPAHDRGVHRLVQQHPPCTAPWAISAPPIPGRNE
jgi:hypothetical protein